MKLFQLTCFSINNARLYCVQLFYLFTNEIISGTSFLKALN